MLNPMLIADCRIDFVRGAGTEVQGLDDLARRLIKEMGLPGRAVE
jgi:hypothetical protein